MANNVINTRIQLKVDTLTNWQTNNPVLLDGEIAIAKIDIVDPENKHLQPAMIKVGDGTSTFSQLDWISAKAADVYAWAKASTKPEYNFEELKNIPDFITPDELENYYTKEEINTKLSNVYKFKGTKDYYFQLPINAEVGDVYNIRYASGENYTKTDITYSNYTFLDTTHGQFLEEGIEAFGFILPFGYSSEFLNNEKVKIGIYSPSMSEGYREMNSFELPILDGMPNPLTNGIYWEEGYLHAYVLKSEEPFSGLDPTGSYTTLFDKLYDDLKNHPWNTDEKPHLQFNNEAQYSVAQPHLVNAGDNVAWTGAEWDALAGTFEVDLSNLATKDELSEKANTADLAAIATSGDIYDISNADAVQTSVGIDDAGEKYIVFNCGSSTTVI